MNERSPLVTWFPIALTFNPPENEISLWSGSDCGELHLTDPHSALLVFRRGRFPWNDLWSSLSKRSSRLSCSDKEIYVYIDTIKKAQSTLVTVPEAELFYITIPYLSGVDHKRSYFFITNPGYKRYTNSAYIAHTTTSLSDECRCIYKMEPVRNNCHRTITWNWQEKCWRAYIDHHEM